MAQEHITRGQIIRTLEIIRRRGAGGLRKEWLYKMLSPIVDGLKKDLADTASETQAQQETAKDEAQSEEKAVKNETPDPVAETDKPAIEDLGDDPKKPARKGQKNKQGNKPKEKNK